MTRSRSRNEKLNIYLINQDFCKNSDSIILKNAKNKILLNIPECSASLYVKVQKPSKPPSWVEFISEGQNIPEDTFMNTHSEGAVILVRFNGNTFAISFGTGHHLIKDEAKEKYFGLRVALNSVKSSELRSLDKTSFDSVPLNTRNQSTRDVEIFGLDIDSEMDIISTVTGKTDLYHFGKVITGKESFIINTPKRICDIGIILRNCLEKYNQQLPEDFSWIDNVREIKDKAEVDILNLELDRKFRENVHDEKIWLGEPEIVEWSDQIGYSFESTKRPTIYCTLDINHLTEYLKKKDKLLTINSIKNTNIFPVNGNYENLKKWNAYNCLYAEITYGGSQYILRGGSWHKVNTDFLEMVNDRISKISIYNKKLPIYDKTRECEYNEESSRNDATIELMDLKKIFYGGNQSQIEFCDLIKDKYDLIHVKKYTSSATLSHLFSQGCVSAEAFASDSQFRLKLNDKLPDSVKLNNIESRPETNKYNIVFAIATHKNLPSELPFFSKLSLKSAMKKLDGLNFKYCLARIEMCETLGKTKTYKPK